MSAALAVGMGSLSILASDHRHAVHDAVGNEATEPEKRQSPIAPHSIHSIVRIRLLLCWLHHGRPRPADAAQRVPVLSFSNIWLYFLPTLGRTDDDLYHYIMNIWLYFAPTLGRTGGHATPGKTRPGVPAV